MVVVSRPAGVLRGQGGREETLLKADDALCSVSSSTLWLSLLVNVHSLVGKYIQLFEVVFVMKSGEFYVCKTSGS
ncbi:hypothetical protein E2C01_096027 [Portunus trituberculatus]|uniref:Uncharacterized protein n=1 Tax=Portunus trituberculatus TaxID=210409 RepID=A0A5B7K5U6_PORTR|nr:hypothetical protein [Portunus trituberculatus]